MQTIELCLKMTVMMGAGLLAGRVGIIDQAFARKFSSLLVNLLIPCMVFSVMVKNSSRSALSAGLAMMLGCFAVVGLGLLVALAVRRLRGRRDDLFYILLPMTMFMNANIIGFPVIQSLYGETALVLANFFMLPYRPMFYTLMPMLTQGFSTESGMSWKRALLKALNAPSIYATVLGLVFGMTGLSLPAPIFSAIDEIGATAIPLGMIACGMYVSDVDIRTALTRPDSWLAVLCRNLLVPAVVFIVFRLLHVPNDVARLCVIFAALPVPSMAALFASRYGRNSALAASTVFLSTACSVLSLPLWGWLLENF